MGWGVCGGVHILAQHSVFQYLKRLCKCVYPCPILSPTSWVGWWPAELHLMHFCSSVGVLHMWAAIMLASLSLSLSLFLSLSCLPTVLSLFLYSLVQCTPLACEAVPISTFRPFRLTICLS